MGQTPYATGHRPYARGHMPEAIGRRPEARGQRPEARGHRARSFLVGSKFQLSVSEGSSRMFDHASNVVRSRLEKGSRLDRTMMHMRVYTHGHACLYTCPHMSIRMATHVYTHGHACLYGPSLMDRWKQGPCRMRSLPQGGKSPRQDCSFCRTMCRMHRGIGGTFRRTCSIPKGRRLQRHTCARTYSMACGLSHVLRPLARPVAYALAYSLSDGLRPIARPTAYAMAYDLSYDLRHIVWHIAYATAYGLLPMPRPMVYCLCHGLWPILFGGCAISHEATSLLEVRPHCRPLWLYRRLRHAGVVVA